MANSTTSSSMTELNKKTMSYLAIILDIIESNNWKKLHDICLSNQSTFRTLDRIVATSDEFNGMTFLHAVVRHDPPFQIVADLIQICPEDVLSRDCLNRTPLHVACGVGARMKTIKCLVEAYPQACNIQDEDGRTPLHFTCDIECQLFEGDNVRERESLSYEVVRCLLAASYSIVGLEDADGMSPLEYAICSDADVKVVKLLQRAAQKHMRGNHAKQLEAKQNSLRQIVSPEGAFSSQLERSARHSNIFVS